MKTRLDRAIEYAIINPGEVTVSEAVLAAISDFQPDQVFSWEKLTTWALESGFIHEPVAEVHDAVESLHRPSSK
jgi:hypothetical protein